MIGVYERFQKERCGFRASHGFLAGFCCCSMGCEGVSWRLYPPYLSCGLRKKLPFTWCHLKNPRNFFAQITASTNNHGRGWAWISSDLRSSWTGLTDSPGGPKSHLLSTEIPSLPRSMLGDSTLGSTRLPVFLSGLCGKPAHPCGSTIGIEINVPVTLTERMSADEIEAGGTRICPWEELRVH